MAITRRLPQSNVGREAAMFKAKEKKDSAGTVNILKADTTALLDVQGPAYTLLQDAVALAEVNYHTAISLKNQKRTVCYMMTSHFIQVFNLAVARGEAPKEHRGFFKIDVNSAAVPDISTDDKLLKVADDVIKGNVNRIAAGGFVMSLPTIAQVTTAYNEYRTAFNDASTKYDALDTAQENVAAKNQAADDLIKKLWADIEGQFAAEEPASRRENSEKWGVAYFTVSDTGTTQTVKVTGTNQDATPNPDYTARLDVADEEVHADENGVANLETEEVGPDNLIVSAPGKKSQTIAVVLVAGETLEMAVELEDV